MKSGLDPRFGTILESCAHRHLHGDNRDCMNSIDLTTTSCALQPRQQPGVGGPHTGPAAARPGPKEGSFGNSPTGTAQLLDRLQKAGDPRHHDPAPRPHRGHTAWTGHLSAILRDRTTVAIPAVVSLTAPLGPRGGRVGATNSGSPDVEERRSTAPSAAAPFLPREFGSPSYREAFALCRGISSRAHRRRQRS